jgi:hypothetical protein
MANARVREDTPAEALPPGAQELALRLMLEETRQIAAQSRLLALNTACESAAACRDAAAAGEMDALGASAERTAGEMERVSAAVEMLIEQIQSASALSQPL